MAVCRCVCALAFCAALSGSMAGEERIFVAEDGEKIAMETVQPDQLDLDFNNPGEMGVYSAGFMGFVLKGSSVYLDYAYFYDDRLLLIVNPSAHDQVMLAVAGEDFLTLVSHGLSAVTQEAGAYFTMFEPLAEQVAPVVHCEADHSSGQVHHADPNDPQSPCHGELGNNGSCVVNSGQYSWNITCQSRITPTGGTVSWCKSNLSCVGLESRGLVNGGPQTIHSIQCHSRYGATDIVVGSKTEMVGGQLTNVGFIQCDGHVTTLTCPN